MAPWLRLAALPSALLLLISASICPADSQNLNLRWPYNLAPDSKYYPEDEVLVKRDIDIQQKLQRSSPTGVRKLNDDAGEKFYLDYWGFGEEQEEGWDGHSSWSNSTFWVSYDLPAGSCFQNGPSNAPQEHPPAIPSTDPTAAVQQDTLVNSFRSLDLVKATWDAVPTAKPAETHCPQPAPVDTPHARTTQVEDKYSDCIDDSAWTKYYDCDELHNGHAITAFFPYNKLKVVNISDINVHFQRHPPSTTRLNHHDNQNDHIFSHTFPDMFHRLPIMSGQSRGRLLSHRPRMRVCQLPCLINVLAIERYTGTAGPTDQLDDDGRDDNHDDHAFDFPILSGHGLSHWVLRLLRILPRRMLSNRTKLRQYIMPCACLHHACVWL